MNEQTWVMAQKTVVCIWCPAPMTVPAGPVRMLCWRFSPCMRSQYSACAHSRPSACTIAMLTSADIAPDWSGQCAVCPSACFLLRHTQLASVRRHQTCSVVREGCNHARFHRWTQGVEECHHKHSWVSPEGEEPMQASWRCTVMSVRT